MNNPDRIEVLRQAVEMLTKQRGYIREANEPHYSQSTDAIRALLLSVAESIQGEVNLKRVEGAYAVMMDEARRVIRK